MSAILIIAFYSCNEDDTLHEKDITSKKTEIEEKTENHGTNLILGEKKENPYSLENMQKAVNIISSTKRGKILEKITLEATHKYVVFIPENGEHLNILSEMIDQQKYVTRPYPMDYEIEQYGEVYVDKMAKSDYLPVLYASIPIGDKIPDVPYKELADLYLPDDEDDESDELIESISVYLAEKENKEQVSGKNTNQSDRILALKEQLNKGGEIQELGLFGRRRYNPQGRVMVDNTYTNQPEPVRNTQIEIYNWFFHAYCYTDNNGQFYCNERFRREMGVYFTWRSTSATIRSHWNEVMGIRVSDKIGNISRGSNGRTFTVSVTNSHQWTKATTHNAVQKYNDYLANTGINQRIHNLNIWAFNDRKGTGIAPMAKKYSFGSLNALLANWATIVAPVTVSIGTFLSITHHELLPDIILNFKAENNTLSYEKLIFHELSHAIHAQQAGQEFWVKFTRRTADNLVDNSDPYKSGILPSRWSGQNIALCEGWANFMQNKMMFDLYGGMEDYNLENFEMYSVPCRFKHIAVNKSGRPWFLHGLMWDLTDNREDKITLNDGKTGSPIHGIPNNIDKVFLGDSGEHSVKALFKALGSGQATGYDLKLRLINLYPTKQTEINQLFYAYGY